MDKILITGASGFIGSFIVEEALQREMEVWAAVRESSSKVYLKDERIHFIDIDLSDKEKIKIAFRDKKFDYVVHAAGATKCKTGKDFYRVNTEGTRNLVDAIRESNIEMKRFIFISSLSIYGPVREKQPYQEILNSDIPKPNTAYGHSKWLAEQYLDRVNFAHSVGANSRPEFPYIILRPTGVYGPRERDYFLMAKSVKNRIDFSAGFCPQDITFVYVKDVVQAVFLSLDRGMSGNRYFLTDGEVYNSSYFSRLIQEELGLKWVFRLKVPLFVLRLITSLGDCIGKLTGKMTALNSDKYHILKQRNWRCDIEPAMDDLGYNPKYSLKRGVKETIKWYKKEGWL